jgi:phenylalanyl-tRNA synthetase beta chain
VKVSVKWLKELVEYPETPKELAEKLTMAGIGVEEINYLGEKLDDKILVGLVEAVNRHPDADKLSLCQVKVGEDTLPIVCGATNVVKGAKVPVALPGSTLPGGLTIKIAKLRGVESNGMICSVQELELNTNLFTKEEQQGILILSPESQVGGKVVDAIGFNDTVLTLELTPNRADCLSVVNVAREVAAVTKGKLTLPEISLEENQEEINRLVKIEIIDPDLCKRYAARLIRNVKIAPSPLWLLERLRASGIRPINNVVDVTNYVMLEMGQPLHAFDYDLLTEGTIIVRRGKLGEKITTLDGAVRELDEEMLLITDPKGPVAIGGVMGGYDTEVTDKTANILLESAYFDSTSIRQTSRKLGLRSEASMRFEKGINIKGVLASLDRAAQLLQQVANGEIAKGIVDIYPEPVSERQVALRVARVNYLLGTELKKGEVEEIFKRLNFTYQEIGDSFLVDIPSYRLDLELEEDLIEEVARLYGYENIKTSLPTGEISQGKKKKHQRLEDLAKDTLTGCGLNEVITFSFTNPKVFDKLNLPKEHPDRNTVNIFNPLSEEQSVMRTTLAPGLLEVAAKNINRRTTNVNIFELGKIYLPANDMLPAEPVILAGLLTGKKDKGWGWAEEAVDFYTMKSVLEALMHRLGIQGIEYQPMSGNPVFHPGRGAVLIAAGKEIGVAGEIHPDVIENFNLEQKTYLFHLQFDLLTDLFREEKRYASLPKYPATERDLAILVHEEVAAEKILRVIKEAAGELLIRVSLFDQYKGQQIGAGYKSLAFNIVYQAADRTLTDEEINLLQEKVRQAVVAQLDAKLR